MTYSVNHPASNHILEAARTLKIRRLDLFEDQHAELIEVFGDREAVIHLAQSLVDALTDLDI